MNRRLGVVVALAAVAASGCASGSSGGGSNDVPLTTPTATAAVPPSTSPSASSTPTSGAENLTLTQDVRHQLLLARAKAVNLPDNAFVRLYKGSAYYAIDHDTGIYWAAGSTVPNRHNMQAEVNSQDEGGYTIFELKPGGEWTAYDAGRDGPAAKSGAQCPIKIPADVLKVWHWAPHTCDPPL